MSSADVGTLGYRIVVAPCIGRFVPDPSVLSTDPDVWLKAGQYVGTVTRGVQGAPVYCPHDGQLIGLLAFPGQPVRTWEPLLWVRVDAPSAVTPAVTSAGAPPPAAPA